MAEVKAFNLGDAFGTAQQGLSYLDYGRKRREQRENRAMGLEDRQRKIQGQDQARMANAQKDMDSIIANIDTESPSFGGDFKKAMGWVGTRNPQISQKAYALSQKSPEEQRLIVENFRRQRGGLGKAPKTSFEQLTLYGPEGQTKRVAVEKGKDFTPEQGWSLSKPSKGMKVYDSQGNLIVDTGGGEMSKKTVGALEAGSMGDYEALHQLEEVKNAYADEFLTYAGQAKGFFDKIKEKAGGTLSEDDKKFVAQKKKFDQRVNQFFNTYKKLITGAAASEKEIASLKKAVINTDLSPTQFKAAYDDMVQGYQRSLRINNRLLREGVKKGTKNWGKRFDALYMTGGDDVVNERAEEIQTKNPDMSEDEIADILINEGYY